MKNIHKVLEDPTRAAVLAQVSRYSGRISAKEIARNIDVPLSTVYGHLKALKEGDYIVATEVRVRNLSKKVWRRTSIGIEAGGSRVLNKPLQQTVSSEPQVVVSYVRFLNALLKENLVRLKKINIEAFTDYQQNTSVPLFVKLYGLTRDDYEFALTKLMELRRELHERAMQRGEKTYQRTNLQPEENFLLFLLAFPDLEG